MDAHDSAEPDVARLFAPVAVEETFAGVLTEARQVLVQLDDPVDAELWGSDLIGALAASAAGQASLMERPHLVAGARRRGGVHPGGPRPAARLRRGRPACPARGRRAGRRADPRAGCGGSPVGRTVGAPQVRDCWHYADVGGRQESLTMTFAYGDKQHAVSVLIDHRRGGKIRDTWVAKGAELRADTEREAGL